MKMMGFLLFISSCVSAFCLAVLVYTMATGEVPINAPEIIKMPEPKAEAPHPDRKDVIEYRKTEEFAASFFERLKKREMEIEEEAKRLDGQRKAAEELIRHADVLQGEMKASEQRLLELLDVIDEIESKNIESLAKLIGTTESKAAAAMLAEMETGKVARIVFFMNQKKAAELFATMIKTDPANAKFVAEVTDNLQRLTDDGRIRDAIAAQSSSTTP
tara:strand:+ start:961 stop:1611 length:651 start_codon:yes stop_codon:yes gene_type:complete